MTSASLDPGRAGRAGRVGQAGRTREQEPSSAAATPSSLVSLGLRAGDTVRFRRTAAGRWHQGRVVGREKDGSVAVRDGKGAARALPIDRLEVRGEGPRGGTVWVPVHERAGGTEQLDLL